MNWIVVVLFSFSLLPTLASTQEEKCTNGEYSSNPKYCEGFNRCSNGKQILLLCPLGTLYDQEDKLCQIQSLAKPLGCPCEKSTFKNFTSICCDKYIQCENGKLTKKSCPAGQRFDKNRRVCSGEAECTQHPKHCPSITTNPKTTSKPLVCAKSPVERNPCTYKEGDRVMPCAQGTSFNPSTCSCSNINDNCIQSTTNPKSVPDAECRPSFVMNFSNPRGVTSYTEKTKTGVGRKPNPYWIKAIGYTSSGNEALMRYRGSLPGYLGIPYFKKNMLKGSFGASVTFRADKSKLSQSFIVLGNRIPDKASSCPGTLEVTASYVYNPATELNHWTVTLNATAVNGKSIPTITRTLQVHTNDHYMKVIVKFDAAKKRISASINDRVILGPQILAEQIQRGNCELVIGYGFVGWIKDVRFYESCGDLTKVM